MKKSGICAVFLCGMLLLLLPPPASAADAVITDVSTASELRAALENNGGAHVRLTKDIAFTRSDAADGDIGVYPGGGCYTIDLNGFTIKYQYKTGGEFSDNGSPLAGGSARLIVVNGPGTLIGGTHGFEQNDQFGTLIVNGGTFKGIMGHGIRMTGGILYLNGGTVTGNFGGIEHEDGIVILNGGDVKSVVHKTMGGITPKKYGLIKDGVFTGDTVLEDIVLVVPDLTIGAGSSIRVIRGGGFVVGNSFVNNGTFAYESGLKSIGGDAVISKDFQVSIYRDLTFDSLSLQERARLSIKNGAVVTVTGDFSTEQNCSVMAENGTLRLLGSIDHKGSAEGVPELAALEGPGGPGRDLHRETEAAHRLRELGLFQGVGVYPDGGVNFDLARAPTRTEALVMLVRLLGKETEAKNGGWKHPFTDVPEWADPYVGYAYETGLTKGSSADTFGTGIASAQMYLTFVLRALGYSDAEGGDFTWDRPEELAHAVGLLPPEVSLDDFLRADVALISEAALAATLKDSRNTLLDKLIAEGAVMLPENGPTT